MIKDAQVTTRGALPAVILMGLVGAGLVATDRASSQLTELARAQDIVVVDDVRIDNVRMQQDDSPCDRIYARTPGHVTCMPIRGNQAIVVTLRDRHLCVAIYDNAGRELVAPTVLDVQPDTSDHKAWRVLEPGLAVAATRSRRLVAIHLHDGDSSRSVLKLHWLDLESLDDTAVQPAPVRRSIWQTRRCSR